MKKVLLWLLIVISVVVLVLRFGTKQLTTLVGVKEVGGIRVQSIPEGAQVLIDENPVGVTPFEEVKLDIGTYRVKVSKDNLSWEGKVDVEPGTLTVVNRELAAEQTSQAGEVLTLEKGKGITVITQPSGASIEIDGKSYKESPALLDIEEGEHIITLSKTGFLKRSIKATTPSDYQLNLTVDLAVTELDLTNTPSPKVVQDNLLVVKNTPTGFLRVRDKPSLLGKEVTRVNPGDELILLEEVTNWSRVRLSDNTEGYVSSTYVEKKK